jgi:hypothetical protein
MFQLRKGQNQVGGSYFVGIPNLSHPCLPPEYIKESHPRAAIVVVNRGEPSDTLLGLFLRAVPVKCCHYGVCQPRTQSLHKNLSGFSAW